MKIAVIGTGIAGMAAAYFLNQKHEITVFEKNNYIGGHSNTVQVKESHSDLGIDTGFIVYNEHNYPHFTRLLKKLNVATQSSQMSFSVRADAKDLEYCARDIKSLFAQKLNLFRPRFYRIWWDFIKLGRQRVETDLSLGQFLDQGGYSKIFQETFILPMVAAIWSAPVAQIKQFPMKYLLHFLENHGLLKIWGRPKWRTISGGSREYVKKLTQPFVSKIQLNMKISRVTRRADRVLIGFEDNHQEEFDHVIFATHADQALKLLEDASENEKSILKPFKYQLNQAILHTDAVMMPVRKQAWAAWNSFVTASQSEFYLTYYMNLLQNLKTDRNYFVSLNCKNLINPSQIIKVIDYEHPVYSFETVQAQQNLSKIQGINRTYFCGSYAGYGFHEDALTSAIDVAKHFGIPFDA